MRFLLLLLLAIPCFAGTYYVATTGNDTTGTGAVGAPWATLTKAAATIPDDGSLVLVADGAYGADTSTITRRFTLMATFRSTNPYKAVLSSNSPVMSLAILNARYVTIEGFEIKRPSTSAAFGDYAIKIGGDYGELITCDHITLRNNIIHDSYKDDLLKINDYVQDVLIEENVFFNQAGPDEHIDINGVERVTVRRNIFFNDFTGSGRSDTDTASFITVKNSALNPVNKTVLLQNNIFLNWQGASYAGYLRIGEDGTQAIEAEEVTVENNLMLSTNAVAMTAPIILNGAKNVLFKNNTLSGHFNATVAGFGFEVLGSNQENEDVFFYNNIFADPAGTMAGLIYAPASRYITAGVDNNLYWNNGNAIPAMGGSDINYASDANDVTANPLLPAIGSVTLPRWTGTAFSSGNTTIAQEFTRLAAYAAIGSGSPAIGAANAANASAADISSATRATPDIGAWEFGGSTPRISFQGSVRSTGSVSAR